MSTEHLSPMQNIDVARVFLNTFGLTLDDSQFDTDSTMDIYDKEKHFAGFLAYTIDKVAIYSKNLRATYSIPEVFSFTDMEYCNQYHKSWSIKVNFELTLDNEDVLTGEFHYNAHYDTELGRNITCCPNLKISNSQLGDIDINILRNGFILGIDINKDDMHEIIHIRPKNYPSPLIKHIVTEGKMKKYLYPYYNSTIINEEGNYFNISRLSYSNNHTHCNDECNYLITSNNFFIQLGDLMNSVDSGMQEKIATIRNMLKYKGTYIFNNIISTALDFFSDEEIKSLIGLEKSNDFYQNNKSSLSDAYFETDNKKTYAKK